MPFSRVVSLVVALFATVLLVALGLLRFNDETATHRPVVPPYNFFWCRTNDDCTIVDQIGCCSCREGGARAAVTKWRRDELAKFLGGACRPMSEQVCVQIDLCSDGLATACINRRCRLVVADD